MKISNNSKSHPKKKEKKSIGEMFKYFKVLTFSTVGVFVAKRVQEAISA